MVTIDIEADLNMEDDEGLNWSLLRNAVEPGRVRPDAVLRAGRPSAWSWVQIVAVDDDGQVHFRQLRGDEARRIEEVLDGSRSYDELLTSQQQAAIRGEWSRRMDDRLEGLDLREELAGPYSELDEATGGIVTRGMTSDSDGPVQP